MEKLTKRQQQAIASKKNIYSTAIRLMKDEGFENITIEKISKEAGVSVGAFYHYFPSKNDIVVELFKEADLYFKNKFVNSSRARKAKEQIIDFFAHFADFYCYYGIDLMKTLYTTQSELFLRQDRVIVGMLQDIVSKGVEKGELTDEMEVAEIVDLLFCTARGVAYKWCVARGEFPLDTVLLKYIQHVLRAM